MLCLTRISTWRMDGYVILIILYMIPCFPHISTWRKGDWVYDIIIILYIILPPASICGTEMGYLWSWQHTSLHPSHVTNHYTPPNRRVRIFYILLGWPQPSTAEPDWLRGLGHSKLNGWWGQAPMVGNRPPWCGSIGRPSQASWLGGEGLHQCRLLPAQWLGQLAWRKDPEPLAGWTQLKWLGLLLRYSTQWRGGSRHKVQTPIQGGSHGAYSKRL